MRRCEKCNISYNGNLINCPLCNHELVGEKTESVFPQMKNRKGKILIKLLLFISIAITMISAFVEYEVKQSFSITTKIGLGLLTNYILTIFIFKKYKHVLKMLNKYLWVILALLFLWYFYTKSLILTTWVIPILCIVILLFNSITMIALQNKFLDSYSSIILLNNLIGLIPFVLVKFNLSTFSLLSYICSLYDVMFFVGMLIFYREKILEEIRKLLNY